MKTGAKIILALGVFLLGQGVSRAEPTSEYMVTGLHDSRTPYILVKSDPNGNSARTEIGLIANRKEEEGGPSAMIAPGVILDGDAEPGIIAQLEITELTGRNESMAIVNGRLMLFHLHSSKDIEGSVIEFGSDQHPVRDILGHLKVRISEITSLKDVAVVQGVATEKGQLVMVSLRQENSFGDGLTFGIFVQRPGKASGDTMPIAGLPVVLDYNFYEKHELTNLLVPDGSGDRKFPHKAISPSAVRGLLEVSSTKSLSEREWAENLGIGLGRQLESGVDAAPRMQVPVYNFVSQELEIRATPEEELFPDIHYIRDPLGKKTGLYSVSPESENAALSDFDKEPIVRGRVHQSKWSGDLYAHEFVSHSNLSKVQLYWIGVEGRIHILAPGRHNKEAVLYENDEFFDPEGLTLVAVAGRKMKEGLWRVYLLQSYENDGDESTEVTLATFSANGALEFEETYVLENEFYDDSAELMDRVVVAPSGEVLFDIGTPRPGDDVVDLKAYRAEHYDPYGEHLSMEENIGAYVQPFEESEIFSGAHFRVFNKEKTDYEVSGIYMPRPVRDGEEKRDDTFIKGQLLTEKPPEAKLSFGNDDEWKFRVNLLAVDPQWQDGKQKVKFLVSLSGLDSGKAAGFDPVFIEEDASAGLAFDSINYVRIVPGIYQNRTKITVFIGFTQEGREGKLKHFVRVLQLNANVDKKDKAVTLSSLGTKTLSVESSEITEFDARLAWSPEGKVLWVDTPNKPRKDKSFALVDPMKPGSRLFINAGENAKKDFLFSDDAQEKGIVSKDGQWRGSRTTSWLLSSAYSLEHKFGEEFTKDSMREARDSHRKVVRAFGGMTDLLEDAANPNNKKKFQVVLLSPDDREAFTTAALRELLNKRNKFWNIDGSLRVFAPNGKMLSQDEFAGNLRSLATRDPKKNERNLLFVDLEHWVDNTISFRPMAGDDEIILENPDPDGGDVVIHPHAAYMMATGGECPQFDKFKEQREVAFQSIILSTPAEWAGFENSLLDYEKGIGLLEQFEVSRHFLTGTWKMWRPNTGREQVEIRRASRMVVSEMEQEAFPSLMSELNRLGDIEAEAQHRILIVPDELKEMAIQLALNQWAGKPIEGGAQKWSHTNPSLELYEFGTFKDQTELFENYEAMGGTKKGVRGAVLGDLTHVKATYRPSTDDPAVRFRISDTVASDDDDDVFADDHEKAAYINPHVLYMLSTEGRRIPLQQFEEKPKPKHPTLLIGTQREWETIQESLTLESRYGLEEAFEVVSLEAPTLDERKRFVTRILERPEIATLGYKFEYDGKPDREARDQLVASLVHSANSQSRQQNLDPTLSLMKVLKEFSKALVEDTTLRRKKIVDRAFIRRVFTKVFNLPLQVQDLAEEDPHRRMEDFRGVALAMGDPAFNKEKRYNGTLDFKYKLLKSMIAHLQGTDSIRSVPSSLILFGDTGSGKTLFFKKLIEVTGMKKYSFRDPHEQESQAIIINVRELIDDTNSNKDDDEDEERREASRKKRKSSGKMTVTEAIEHIENQLAKPEGYKSLVLFDDLHAGSPAVKKRLLSFLSSVFEAPDGRYMVRDLRTGENKEIPVRNLLIGATLNPPDDPKYRALYDKAKTDKERVVYCLIDDGLKIEKSFVERWGNVIQLEKFPVEAKGPALLDNLRSQMRDTFDGQGRLSLVDPRSVNDVVRKFPGENAREFIEWASRGFLSVADSHEQLGRLNVIVPTQVIDEDEEIGEDLTPPLGASTPDRTGSRGRNEIGHFVESHARALPVSKDDFKSRLIFLTLVQNNFRTHIFQALSRKVVQDRGLNADWQSKQMFVTPMVHAINAHLLEFPYLHHKMIELDPYDFGMKTAEGKAEFERFVKAVAGSSKDSAFIPNFPFGKASMPADVDALKPGYRADTDLLRKSVLGEQAYGIHTRLSQTLALFMRAKSAEDIGKETAGWVKSMQPEDGNVEISALGDDLYEAFRSHNAALSSSEVYETRKGSGAADPGIYDSMRLYLHAIDRAIGRLPWHRVDSQLIDFIELVAGDLDFGQLPAVEDLLFGSDFSPFRMLTSDSVFQITNSSEPYQDASSGDLKNYEKQYSSNCERFLLTNKKGARND